MNDQRQLLGGLAVVRIDAGPNDVAMLPPVLGVGDDSARLADQLRGPRTVRNSAGGGGPRFCTFRGSDRSVFRRAAPAAISSAPVRETQARQSRSSPARVEF
jgi:hypothetical protein